MPPQSTRRDRSWCLECTREESAPAKCDLDCARFSAGSPGRSNPCPPAPYCRGSTWRFGLSLLLAACGASSGGDEVGGETDFLSICQDTAECGGELICACGICTRPCTSTSECSDAPEGVCSVDDTARSLAACGAIPGEALCVLSRATPSNIDEPDGGAAAPEWTEVERVDRFEQESFSKIWGSGDALWVVGQQVQPVTTGPAVGTDEPPPASKLRRMDLGVASGSRQWELVTIWTTGFRGLIEHYDGQEWKTVRVRDDHTSTGPLAGSPEQGLWMLMQDLEDGYDKQQLLRLREGDWGEFSSKDTTDDNLMDLWVTDKCEVWVVGKQIARLR